MSNQKINITGSGSGQISVGNVVQAGGNADVRGDVTLSASQLRDKLLESLPAAANAAPPPERAAVEQQVSELSAAVAAPEPDQSRIKQILTTLKEHHDWAFPVITSTLKKLAPWVASLI